MISIDAALQMVLADLPSPKAEQISIRLALGRVLAENLTATVNLPPFNRAAKDGYAVCAADVQNSPIELECVGEIRAGGHNRITLQKGQALAIMTGAPLPEGADAVQMIEKTKLTMAGQRVLILEPVKPGDEVTPLGSEAFLGEVVLESGRTLGPLEIALLATFGYSSISVWQIPRIGVLATGDELVELEATPGPSQIRNSNALSLSSQLGLLGLKSEYLGIARDDRMDLLKLIMRGLENDVLILSGGVSAGKYDYVKDVFSELGLGTKFSQVAMKPGKPTVFARKDDKLIFGLPGNPISSFIAFEVFVRPVLGRLCGLRQPELPRIKGELLSDMSQQPGRTAFLPAWVSWQDTAWRIMPLKFRGSADIVGFSRANAAVIFPGERDFLGAGEWVEAMLFPDYFNRRQL